MRGHFLPVFAGNSFQFLMKGHLYPPMPMILCFLPSFSMPRRIHLKNALSGGLFNQERLLWIFARSGPSACFFAAGVSWQVILIFCFSRNLNALISFGLTNTY